MAAMRLGRYTKGASLTTSLPCSEKVKAPSSATKLSPTSSLAIFLCCRSLAMDMLNDLNHLTYSNLVSLTSCVLSCNYLLKTLNLFQGIDKSAFMASASLAGTEMGSCACSRRLCLSTLDNAFTSAASCEVLSLQLVIPRTALSTLVRLRTVLVQAVEDSTLPAGTCTKVMGFNLNIMYSSANYKQPDASYIPDLGCFLFSVLVEMRKGPLGSKDALQGSVPS